MGATEVGFTRLNQLEGGGTGRPDLSVRSSELTPISEDAGRLARIASKGGQAAGSTYDAVEDLRTAGLSSGDGLHHAMWRFTQQSLNLSRDCDRIAGHLGSTVSTHAALEDDTTAQLRGGTQPLQRGNPDLDALAY